MINVTERRLWDFPAVAAASRADTDHRARRAATWRQHMAPMLHGPLKMRLIRSRPHTERTSPPGP
eukprot:6162096-Prymnesium_polylepis.1